jgi:type II secretory pathway component GspD/PulD (secretin)
MQRHRLPSPFAMLLLTFAIADAAAQAPRPPGQPPQQTQTAQQAQPAQQAAQFQQPVGQPLLVVPQPGAQAPAGPRINPGLPTVELAPLLERVERASNKQFLLDGRVGPQIYLAGVEPNDVTYPLLLSILRANGFAAFESEGRVNIVPEAEIRFHAPVVATDDSSIPADLIVTRVLTAANIEVVYLVPMLRPLLPQSAHLAAHMNSNRLLIMDRYENIQRITEIIRALDVPPRQ